MEALGHIRTDWITRRVHVTAPRLIVLPGEHIDECEAVLAGARNPDLLEELKYLAGINNLRFSKEEIGIDFPERIALKGSIDALKKAAHACRSFTLAIADDPMTPDAWRLLSRVLPLRSTIQNLREKTNGIGKGEPTPSAEVSIQTPALLRLGNP